ncbi:MAG: hypothetical protein PHF63_02135 [Herbinix sp.]|nr:hypothetical protein [Herbinix sp.]
MTKEQERYVSEYRRRFTIAPKVVTVNTPVSIVYKVDLTAEVEPPTYINRHLIRWKHTQNNYTYPEWLDNGVQKAYNNEDYDMIYKLLLDEKGFIHRLSARYEYQYKIPYATYFSEFQTYLFLLIEFQQGENWEVQGISLRTYNEELSFMGNLYNHLKNIAKDIYRKEVTAKKSVGQNEVLTDFSENKEDNKHQFTEQGYTDSEYLLYLSQLDIPQEDKRIMIQLATGEIEKKDIPLIFNWDNRDRKKLSRYMQKLGNYLI